MRTAGSLLYELNRMTAFKLEGKLLCVRSSDLNHNLRVDFPRPWFRPVVSWFSSVGYLEQKERSMGIV